jgi:hypothetical protein
MALTLDSAHTKAALQELSENIIGNRRNTISLLFVTCFSFVYSFKTS